MRKISANNKGFTLIELLVVIVIIVVFASIVIAAIGSASANSRDNERLINMKDMQVSVERYYDANNQYPSTENQWWGNCSAFGSHPATGPTGYVPGLSPTYLPKLPIDPRQTAGSCYLYNSDGLNYMILAYGTVEGAVPAQYQRPAYPSEQDYAIYTPGASGW
jgi:general secretion pathway protein G